MPVSLQTITKKATNTSGALVQKNLAGTGGLDDQSIEAEYLCSFSDECDDS
jgi:hypothetical protein